MRITVGYSKLLDPFTKKERPYKYSDITSDKGWVDNVIYLPIPFDLMYLKVKDNPKILSGWWDGTDWNGLRLKKDHEITKWKRNQDYA
jgi:hypothetical protein